MAILKTEGTQELITKTKAAIAEVEATASTALENSNTNAAEIAELDADKIGVEVVDALPTTGAANKMYILRTDTGASLHYYTNSEWLDIA